MVARGGEWEKAELEEDDQEVQTSRGFPGGSVVKIPPPMQETQEMQV